MRVHHDLSPRSALVSVGESPSTEPSVPASGPDVLGAGLNCSESKPPERFAGFRPSRRATDAAALGSFSLRPVRDAHAWGVSVKIGRLAVLRANDPTTSE